MSLLLWQRVLVGLVQLSCIKALSAHLTALHFGRLPCQFPVVQCIRASEHRKWGLAPLELLKMVLRSPFA